MALPNSYTFISLPAHAFTVLSQATSHTVTDASLRAKGVSVRATLVRKGACCPCENGNGSNVSRGMKGPVHERRPQSFRDYWILYPSSHSNYKSSTFPDNIFFLTLPPSMRTSYTDFPKGGSRPEVPSSLPLASFLCKASLWPTCRLWFQFQPMRCSQAGFLKMVSKHSRQK